MSDTPTIRTLRYMRGEGYTCDITEHWNHFVKRRKDLFGFVDIVAAKPGERLRLIQCTSGDNVSKRIEKIQTIPVAVVLAETCSIFVVGWRKVGKPARWQPRFVQMIPDGNGKLEAVEL